MATTTPNYGWDVPTSTDYVKDGATAIETLGDDIDATLYTALGGAYPGLRLVKKQAIGSGVSSVSVTNAFSATYDNYKIMLGGTVGSTNLFLAMTLTGSSANYNNSVLYASYAGGAAATATLGTTSWSQAGDVQTDGCSLNVELGDPFNAKRTGYRSLGVGMASNGNNLLMSGNHTLATSYTGFTLTTSSGTITGGNIYVYGYGTS
jgi:hypothetical protein